MSNTAESRPESKPNQIESLEEPTASETIVNTKESQDEPAAKEAVSEAANKSTTVDVSQKPSQPESQEPVEQLNLPENVRILKEAFPDTDVEVIEAVLHTQNDNVESGFEILLGMSDPTYNPPSTVDEQAPPMPPRPQTRQNSGNAPYAYWERQAQPEPTTVEEQLRMDEEFAKRLALEDERASQNRRRSSEQPQRQQQPQRQDDDDSLFNFQDELPIIKEKMKEAGNAAKKKMMDLYNQFKANTQKNNPQTMNEKVATSSMPTTNAQYRGLPSDDGDDLLTGDISALHLSDYDVYAKTNGRPRKSNDDQSTNNRGDGVIHVNPPMGSPMQKTLSNTQTSTSDAQLKADEDFARQLAEEEQIEARRPRNSSPLENNVSHAPPMPARKTVIIAPKSPLEFEGDSDYEDVRLTAAPATNNTKKRNTDTRNNSLAESASIPYVIGDDDDSDSDDLVDIDDEEFKEDAYEQAGKTQPVAKDSVSSKKGVITTIKSSPTTDTADVVDYAASKSTTDNTEASITH
ncbi:hypothetical protein BD408DRAFT_421276 [Parasitella parasitica]|nr:hypothetical protein BD408DRAFT_421276 [Parasitella parasitica]